VNVSKNSVALHLIADGGQPFSSSCFRGGKRWLSEDLRELALSQHNVYVLHARLAALRRICLILCQYRSRRSLCLLLSKNHRKFRHDPTIALWSYGNSPLVYPLLL
jgi:hypothetical protein